MHLHTQECFTICEKSLTVLRVVKAETQIISISIHNMLKLIINIHKIKLFLAMIRSYISLISMPPDLESS